eukprot:snap_masked-scaffold_6-processed-gene-2.24-mRNA-1 protein AED:1.00 eAED:1.00 QI:0/-1/0/0/-1/1/1/0/383
MITAEVKTFGDKLFDNGTLLEADFKRVSYWTEAERREYMTRAMRKHRLKEKMRKKKMQQELLSLKESQTSIAVQANILKDMELLLSRQKTGTLLSWNSSYLLKRNELLREEASKLRSQRYIYTKFLSIRKYFPCFEFDKFQAELQHSLKNCFEILKEFDISNHGRAFFFSKQLKGISKRSELKKQINVELKSNTSKFGNLTMKSFFVDVDFSTLSNFKMKVVGVDFVQYTDIFYEVLKYNKVRQNSAILRKNDIIYDVMNLDSRDVPFYCPPEYKKINFDVQAVNLAFCHPKSNFPKWLMVTSMHRNNDVALILKCALCYDEETGCFSPAKKCLVSSILTKSKKYKDTLFVRSSSTFLPEKCIEEYLNIYEGVMLRKKAREFC